MNYFTIISAVGAGCAISIYDFQSQHLFLFMAVGAIIGVIIAELQSIKIEVRTLANDQKRGQLDWHPSMTLDASNKNQSAPKR